MIRAFLIGIALGLIILTTGAMGWTSPEAQALIMAVSGAQ